MTISIYMCSSAKQRNGGLRKNKVELHQSLKPLREALLLAFASATSATAGGLIFKMDVTRKSRKNYFGKYTARQLARLRLVPSPTSRKLVRLGLVDYAAMGGMLTSERFAAEREAARQAVENHAGFFSRRELAGLARVGSGEPFSALDAVRSRS